MHARFERIKAVGCCKMEILGLQGAEEALNCRVVKAVALTAHALLDSTLRKQRSIGLHLVVPALIRVNDQFRRARGPRKRCPKRAGNPLKFVQLLGVSSNPGRFSSHHGVVVMHSVCAVRLPSKIAFYVVPSIK